MNELEDIKRMNVRPGDVLVLRFPGALSEQQRTIVHEQMRCLSDCIDVPCIVLDDGATFEIISKEQTP